MFLRVVLIVASVTWVLVGTGMTLAQAEANPWIVGSVFLTIFIGGRLIPHKRPGSSPLVRD